MNLKGDHGCRAEVYILESRTDPETSRRVVTGIVQRGVLKHKDLVVLGTRQGRIKSLVDAAGSQVESATPSSVGLAGFRGGATFVVAVM